MRHRAVVMASATACLVLLASAAQAQISSCLRPLGIPDKWIENQTPPWDPTDTFDPTGPTPDVYAGGYDPVTDQGLPMSLVLYNRFDPPAGHSAWPVQVSEPGSLAFHDAIVGCSGYPHAIGDSFPSVTGGMGGPFGAAIADLIAQDPEAVWDPLANSGRGGVVNSKFPQSPRIIALPVFAPDAYGASTSMSPPMVKIVGFFVSERTTGAVHGYVTGWSQITVPAVTVRTGEWAQLSATVTAPGSPVAGLHVEFLHDDLVVATAETDGTGTARPSTTAFKVDAWPGVYPGAIRARLREFDTFFVADEAAADLTVQRKLPVITWPQPADITYGTPLGPEQLNASADVPGVFTYTPAAGTVLPAAAFIPVSLTATFVPDDSELYEETTATTLLAVQPAPLLLTITDAQKLYLDPLPQFTFTATGLVNGDDLSAIGTTVFQTTATATSPVGTYEVSFAAIGGGDNYMLTLTPGVLTIVPRPTTTHLASSASSPSTYGQTVVFTITVSSGAGVPGGTVTLRSGGVPLGSVTLVNGQATFAASLSAGNHSLTASFAAGGGFAASTSATVSHTVNRASTAAQLTSSVNPSRSGQAVTFTATVAPVAPGAGVPTGSVEFLRGGVVLGTAALSGGTAQLTTAALAVGKHAIQARYAGTADYLPSVSGVVQQTVKGGGK